MRHHGGIERDRGPYGHNGGAKQARPAVEEGEQEREQRRQQRLDGDDRGHAGERGYEIGLYVARQMQQRYRGYEIQHIHPGHGDNRGAGEEHPAGGSEQEVEGTHAAIVIHWGPS